ncbi:MAG: bifunctional phosphoribosylaminoimidazolecarboxamide formyltransferase/IMP cyclohydrolase [Kiritimatiellae bacterium]|nr:bifunctional phosphoribosylaminoimidazolecarboxamide formyltransferase/IMP cyclohydrolase [Kiritimatiellia bacterium]
MDKIKRALISVSDKTGIIDFAKGLVALNIEILSTGGTASILRESGLSVTDISEFTGFPEMLDGRVKTLHPKVHAGLLFVRENDSHNKTMKEHDFVPIDLICVNSYPFEETVQKGNTSFEQAIEQIDIGGPTMLRSAAKNMKSVTVLVDPEDYPRVLNHLKNNNSQTSESLRIELAQKAFSRAAEYNAAIAQYMATQVPQEEKPVPPFVLSCGVGTTLRYGENPDQSAIFYKDVQAHEACIAHTELLHGKEMSYNNYVDGDAALEAVKELAGQPAVSIIKHTNPCGYATGKKLSEALEAAWEGDPVSAFGSVIAATEPVDLKTAEALKGRFVEVLIAPDFEPDAIEYLTQKSKNLRLLKCLHPMTQAREGVAIKQINGGFLVQDRDIDSIKEWNIPTQKPFSLRKQDLAEFGVKACKHVKSNAILLVREYQSGYYSILGMGAGQPNRVDAVRKLAISKACENIEILYKELKPDESLKSFARKILSESILISDAFFPFPDSVQYAAEAGIRYVVQPGGSKRDAKVIEACDECEVAMALTNMRHFKH